MSGFLVSVVLNGISTGLGIWPSPYWWGNTGQDIDSLWGSVFSPEKLGMIMLKHTNQSENLLGIIQDKQITIKYDYYYDPIMRWFNIVLANQKCDWCPSCSFFFRILFQMQFILNQVLGSPVLSVPVNILLFFPIRNQFWFSSKLSRTWFMYKIPRILWPSTFMQGLRLASVFLPCRHYT